MATVAQRIARLEERIGNASAPNRVIFIDGGDAPEEEYRAFLEANDLRLTARDIVFRTIYETKPGNDEAPMPLQIRSMSTLGGRPLAV